MGNFNILVLFLSNRIGPNSIFKQYLNLENVKSVKLLVSRAVENYKSVDYLDNEMQLKEHSNFLILTSSRF